MRHRLGLERAVCHLTHGDIEALGDSLQKRPISRGALRVEPEVGHRPVVQEHDLDVNAADVADAIRVREEVKSGGGVSNGLHHRAVRSQNAFQQILAVSGQGKSHDVLVADHASNLPEQ